MSNQIADVWVVAGAPGAGKTTVSDVILQILTPTPALLDKDTMFGSFTAAILAEAGRPNGEREGDWYDEHIKVHEYAGMIATTREIRAKGCPVLLSGPFTSQIHNVETWNGWVDQLGGKLVHLVWVQTDKETLRKRLELRHSERDTEKLAKFDEFVNYMQLESPPPVNHFVVDNRKSASDTIEKQITKLLKFVN